MYLEEQIDVVAVKFISSAEFIISLTLACMTGPIRSFLVHMELLIRQTFSRSAPGLSANERGNGTKKGVPRETSGLLESQRIAHFLEVLGPKSWSPTESL